MLRVWDPTKNRILQSTGIALAVIICLAVGAAILFPVFEKPHFSNPGMLLDPMGQPLPNTTVTVRSGDKRVTVTTNLHGGFDLPNGLRVDWNTQVEGYALALRRHSSGAGTRYLFSRRGNLTVECMAEGGARVAARVAVQTYSGALGLNARGTARLLNIPIGIPDSYITVTPVDLHMRLKRYERNVTGDEVKIRAVFARQKVPFPRRTPMSYASGKVAFHGW